VREKSGGLRGGGKPRRTSASGRATRQTGRSGGVDRQGATRSKGRLLPLVIPCKVMADFGRWTSTNFMVLSADTPIRSASAVFEALSDAAIAGPSHIVIERLDDDDVGHLYLYSKAQFVTQVSTATPDDSLLSALSLLESDTAPIVSLSQAERSQPSRAVVVDRDAILAVIDYSPGQLGGAPLPPTTPVAPLPPMAPPAPLPPMASPEPLPPMASPEPSPPMRPRAPSPPMTPGAPPRRRLGGRLRSLIHPGKRSPKGTEPAHAPATRGAASKSDPPGSASLLVEPDAHSTGRTLVAEFPATVELDSEAWLLASLTSIAAAGIGIPVEGLNPGDVIDVLVQPRHGFTIEGMDKGSIDVPDGKESLPLQFKLKATNVGIGAINVLAFYQGRPLGRIELTPTIIDQAHQTTEVNQDRQRSEQPLAPATVQLPDLTLFVESRWDGSGPEYLIRLTASDPALGLNLKKFGPLSLNMDPKIYFGEFFAEIEELPLETAEDRHLAALKLGARGDDLFRNVFPGDLQSQIWSLRENIKSIVIQSEEPWIPWELCKLSGDDETGTGQITEGPFLCEAYSVTRWMPGTGFKALKLSNIALVVPSDSGLPLAEQERDFVLSLATEGRHVTLIPATYADIYAALSSGKYDGWHFTGHGAFRDANPDRSSVLLEDNVSFTPQDLSGLARNLGQASPFVFLNACQIGQQGMSLTGIGGWAKRFVEAGAGAFIGAYWSVFDDSACQFTKEVYTRLLSGMPVGQVVQQARVSISKSGDPTWLAYTAFSDPMAVIEV
jgi:CHAT domain/Ternary complex associated domain 7